MKKISNKRVFGFGFDRGSYSTGNGLLMDAEKYPNGYAMTTTQRYRHDIRDAVRDIYFQAST